MESVTVAVGSNVGDRHQYIRDAGEFLSSLSKAPLNRSAIYLTEPVGPASRYFLNAAVEIATDLAPSELIACLKNFEQKHGRSAGEPRWSARTIDLDIIAFGNLVLDDDSLIIPHPEYHKRLFVLKPLQDIHPNWKDPDTDKNLQRMIENAPKIQIRKTNLDW